MIRTEKEPFVIQKEENRQRKKSKRRNDWKARGQFLIKWMKIKNATKNQWMKKKMKLFVQMNEKKLDRVQVKLLNEKRMKVKKRTTMKPVDEMFRPRFKSLKWLLNKICYFNFFPPKICFVMFFGSSSETWSSSSSMFILLTIFSDFLTSEAEGSIQVKWQKKWGSFTIEELIYLRVSLKQVGLSF